MRIRISLLQRLAICVTSLVFFAACSTISPFNQKAYEQATSLKVDALSVMDKATAPFATQKQSVDALKLNLEKAYEYANGLPQNTETTQQWAIIKDPSRNSLGGFLKRWEEKSKLSTPFIQEAKGIVSDGFDAVIELESGKRKSDASKKQ
jgi:hypothetical protein